MSSQGPSSGTGTGFTRVGNTCILTGTPSQVPPGYPFDKTMIRDASDWIKYKKQARIYNDYKLLYPNTKPIVRGNDFRLEWLNGENKCVPCDANAFSGKPTIICFLAGSLVNMADGTTKAIEDVRVNELVIGAFGEINTVLALHRPMLGNQKMCKINNEHNTTFDHPHVSIDKKFYCGDPDLFSNFTYGQKYKVIDADGNMVDRVLHRLKKERIQKLQLGVELKTIEGSRITKSIEVYSMPEDTQLYNLVIGGSHTYHVDGYAVTGWPSELDFDYDTWCVNTSASS